MSPDYKKSIALLERINALTIRGVPISTFFERDGYDMWGTFQMSIFADIKRYTVNPEAYKKDKRNRASLLRLLLLIESLLALIVIRPQVLVYTIDKISSKTAKNDGRIDSLYEVLVREKVPYLEVIHAVSGYTTLGNFITRRRLAVYLEAFMWGKVHDVLEHEDPFIKYIINKYYNRLYAFRGLRYIVRLTMPKVFFGIDDVRHTGELLIQAKKAGVPSYIFQHGHFTKYHVGWLSYTGAGNIPRADHIVVWNEYWKKELLRLGTYYPEHAIVVGGEKIKKEISLTQSDELSVLIPYETDAPKDEVKAYIAECNREGIKVYLKVRNDISHPKQIEEYGDVQSVTDIVPATAVVGVYSTLLYDVLGVLPVGMFDTSMDYGRGMVENGLAGLVRLGHVKQDIVALKKVQQETHSKLLSDTVYSILHTCGIPLKK